MTVNYRGHSYGHQQIWALVAALNADGYAVKMGALPATGMWCWIRRYEEIDGEDRRVESYLRRGEPGDRTPFRALARAIAKMDNVSDERTPRATG